MWLDTYLNPPLNVFDLTNNYWGTDSAETIAGWILDYYDCLLYTSDAADE